jgi:hypothetical protein
MNTRSENSRAGLAPVIVAAVAAVAGLATIFLFEFSPPRNVATGTVGMVTSAAVERAGATVLPTDPAAHTRPAIFTR